MFRRIEDFARLWRQESEATLSLLSYLNDEALTQRVNSKGRSLGFLAWHLTQSMRDMAARAGLPIAGPDADTPRPQSAEVMKQAYGEAACSVVGAVRQAWSDDTLDQRQEMYGEQWERGKILSALILHQAHHRGQMTVLMRQAGLPVPGLYGPSYEEWATIGLPPME
jgi:uncharacterized damage-inducible protein DinB